MTLDFMAFSRDITGRIKMSYESLASEVKKVLEEYKRQRKWCCWSLPQSDKASYILQLIDKLNESSSTDFEKESILGVALSAFFSYLKDKKNDKLSKTIETLLMDEVSENVIANLEKDEIVDVVIQAKDDIRNYSLVEMSNLEKRSDSISELADELIPTMEKNWPDAVIRVIGLSCKQAPALNL